MCDMLFNCIAFILRMCIQYACFWKRIFLLKKKIILLYFRLLFHADFGLWRSCCLEAIKSNKLQLALTLSLCGVSGSYLLTQGLDLLFGHVTVNRLSNLINVRRAFITLSGNFCPLQCTTNCTLATVLYYTILFSI